MAKLRWNKFIDTYSKKICFIASVSASLPKGIELDTNGRKLPSPYALFCEWCETYLDCDWSATKIKGGFLLCVLTEEDTKTIRDKFKIIGQGKVRLPLYAKKLIRLAIGMRIIQNWRRRLGMFLNNPTKAEKLISQ